ncbi:nitrilase-related carbon-nitrogen hydrolase [Catenuloplanes japonicus]|uniref:nitrilase-related carbon-nitrogen hydrolase n=1 Tax=Catenuloplanes japonicus TaxID=33876 RepID=UPI0038B847E6
MLRRDHPPRRATRRLLQSAPDPGEAIFTPGAPLLVFDEAGVCVGISICADTRFPGTVAAVAAQGALVLLVPAQHITGHAVAQEWRDRHHEIRTRERGRPELG